MIPLSLTAETPDRAQKEESCLNDTLMLKDCAGERLILVFVLSYGELFMKNFLMKNKLWRTLHPSSLEHSIKRDMLSILGKLNMFKSYSYIKGALPPSTPPLPPW